ncbi:MAG: c-type cytochrome, partial [Rhodopirellula sp. JB044]|uniref:c-type cytochrome n=1 Tax=Rhodopirellula sp. JB044 TaxID=3342844 RepID=UPI00370B6CDD
MRTPNAFSLAAVVLLAGISVTHAETASGEQSYNADNEDVQDAAVRGYEFLLENALLPSDFDQEVFDALWQSWPKELREKAEAASPAQRRAMAFRRYGLTPRSGSGVGEAANASDDQAEGTTPDPGKPLQYVVDQDGRWTMNCFSCHGGSVYGTPTPGAPNNRFALQTLTEEVRRTKFRLGKPLGRMELGSLVVPLGTTHGTTNAVVFGQGLMHYRDDELNLVQRAPASFTHHDMDAPPWWHFYRRPYIYIDGFAPKGHRGLMQFALVPENDADFFRENEDAFRDVYAYLSSLRPPKYPLPVDAKLAEAGRHLFEQNCAECHGTYGHESDAEAIAAYPNRMVSIDEIGTDPVRHQALNVSGREHYARSWFANARESTDSD